MKGGHTEFWDSFNTGARGFGHAEGGRKKVPPFKRGGGGAESFTMS